MTKLKHHKQAPVKVIFAFFLIKNSQINVEIDTKTVTLVNEIDLTYTCRFRHLFFDVCTSAQASFSDDGY
jgi:hypothetical protein